MQMWITCMGNSTVLLHFDDDPCSAIRFVLYVPMKRLKNICYARYTPAIRQAFSIPELD